MGILRSMIDDLLKRVVNSGKVSPLFEPSVKIEGKPSGSFYVYSYEFPNSSVILKDRMVICSSGCRSKEDGHLNEFINVTPLLEDFDYKVDDVNYRTDNLGRVISVSCCLPINKDIQERPKHGQETLERMESMGKLADDEAGHIIARCLGGPNEIINVVPMNTALNEGAYQALEKLLLAQSKCHSIELSVDLRYAGDCFRPESLVIHAFISDGGGKIDIVLDNPSGPI